MTRRVTIVLHEPAVGGATLAVLNPLAELESEGWRFSFWVPRPSPIADLLEARGYAAAGEPRELRYSRRAMREPPGTWSRARSVPGYLRRFRRFAVAADPDLVHVNTVVALPEALAARSAGFTTMLNVHEMLDGVRGAAAARLARLVDGVVTDSHACAAPLRARGVNVDVVSPCLPPPQSSPPSRPRDRLIVGTLATVCQRKGSDIFVAAARSILQRRQDVEFRLVGRLATGVDEPWARRVVALGERHGVRWSVTSEPYSELLNWDIFVLPTRRDPFPLIVLQAMAAGLPVVASAVDGVCEQVDDASGILVDSGDPHAFASAIERLLDDAPLRGAMGHAGSSRVATAFGPHRQAADLTRAYESLIRNGRQRHRKNGRRRVNERIVCDPERRNAD